MDNPETLATLGKQENGKQTKTHTHSTKKILNEQNGPAKNPMVNAGSREG
jgi:hypothetical protein